MATSPSTPLGAKNSSLNPIPQMQSSSDAFQKRVGGISVPDFSIELQDLSTIKGRISNLSTGNLYNDDSSTIFGRLEMNAQKVSNVLFSDPTLLTHVLSKAVRENHLSLFSKVLKRIENSDQSLEELCSLNAIFSLIIDNYRIEMIEALKKISSLSPDRLTAMTLSQPFIVLLVKNEKSDENRKLQMIDYLLSCLPSEREKVDFLTKSRGEANVVIEAARLGYAKMIQMLTKLLPHESREQFLTYPLESPGSGRDRTALFYAKNTEVVVTILDPLSQVMRDRLIDYEYTTFETESYGCSAGGGYSRTVAKRHTALQSVNREVATAILGYSSNQSCSIV